MADAVYVEQLRKVNKVDGLDLFATFPGMGQGVRATAALKAGRTVATVSAYVRLYRNGRKDSGPFPSLDEALDFLEGLDDPKPSKPVVAALAVMHLLSVAQEEVADERCKAPSTDAASFLVSYLRRLPREFSTPAFWPPQDLELLRATFLFSGPAPKLGVGTKENYETVVVPIAKQRPLWWPASCTSYDAFRRAAAIVETRCFQQGDDGPYLVPIVDFFNHSSAAPHVTVDHVTSAGSEVCFAVKTTRDVAKGDQVFNTYGSGLSAAELLLRYGFFDMSRGQNAVAPVVIPEGVVAKALECPASRVHAVLEACCVAEFVLDARDVPPPWLSTAVSVCGLDDDEYEQWLTTKDIVGDIDDEEAYDEVMQAVVDVINCKLETYHGSQEAPASDKRAAEDKSLPYNARAAAFLRWVERMVLVSLRSQLLEMLSADEAPQAAPQPPPPSKKKRVR
eukprot:m51a1_g5617 hypothetical protein (451) ;mRNA; r:754767-756264